jgi:hypothetical protein
LSADHRPYARAGARARLQFGGESSKKLPRGGAWKCLDLSLVEDAKLRDGPWREGGSHKTGQRCVDEIDLDINIHVRKLR